MGNVAIISGASSGLGLSLAKSVPFQARVIDISRSGPPRGSEIEHIPADLSDPVGWSGVIGEIQQVIETERPERSVFIHAAGTLTPIGFAGEVAIDSYIDNVLLNSAAGQVLGHGYLTAINGLPGSYDLVMISSGAATKEYSGWSAYGAGKAALNQWVRYVGSEQLERGGARVSAIAPGVINTGMQNQIREASAQDFPDVERFRSLHADGELKSPEQAARRLWSLVEAGIESGSVLDLRDLQDGTGYSRTNRETHST